MISDCFNLNQDSFADYFIIEFIQTKRALRSWYQGILIKLHHCRVEVTTENSGSLRHCCQNGADKEMAHWRINIELNCAL